MIAIIRFVKTLSMIGMVICALIVCCILMFGFMALDLQDIQRIIVQCAEVFAGCALFLFITRKL